MLCADGELNVLEDILTEAPDHDDELYNPESERDVIDKKGTQYCLCWFLFEEIWNMMSACVKVQLSDGQEIWHLC